MAFISVDQLVRQLCRETGEPDYKNYDTIVSHVRGALIDLNLYATNKVKTAYVDLNKLRNINWPEDCIKPLKIFLEREGISYPLAMGKQSGPRGEQRADFTTEQTTPPHSDPCPQGELSAYYDRERRIVHLNLKAQKGDKFLLAYNCDGVSGAVSMIPVEMETAIGEWVFWKYYRRTNPALSDRGRMNYKEEYYRLRKLYQQSALQEWLEAALPE